MNSRIIIHPLWKPNNVHDMALKDLLNTHKLIAFNISSCLIYIYIIYQMQHYQLNVITYISYLMDI